MVLSLKKLNPARASGQVKLRLIASYQELCLEMGDSGPSPSSVCVVWSRGGRREATQPVQWRPTIRIYEWPVPQNIEITVTLRKNEKTGQFENKDWFFTIEDQSSSGRVKELAKARINIKDYAEDLSQQTLDLKMRPLGKRVKFASLSLTLSGQFVSRRLSDVSVVSKADLELLEKKAEETVLLFPVVNSGHKETKVDFEEDEIGGSSEEEDKVILDEEAKIEKNTFDFFKNVANEKYATFTEHIKTVVSDKNVNETLVKPDAAIKELDMDKQKDGNFSLQNKDNKCINDHENKHEECTIFVKHPNTPKESNLDDEIRNLDQEQSDIVEQIAILDNRLRETLETDPMDYDNLLQLRTALVNRKNAVLQKQMHLNLIEKEAELEERYLVIQKQLQDFGEIDDTQKTEEDTRKEGLLMEELFNIVDQRNELLMQKHQQEQLIEEEEITEQRNEGYLRRNN